MIKASMYAEALNETLEHFGISAREIATGAGVREAALSQFRNGKKDLNLESWERLVRALPLEAKQYLHLKVLVGELDNRGLSMLLSAVSYRLMQDAISESQQIASSNLPEKTLALI